jgi:amino acid permease
MTMDPLAVLASPPDASINVLSSVLHMVPVIITTLMYQNIVPTVTRILDYDRAKVTAAVTLGSVIPLCIYLAWSHRPGWL